MASVIISSNSWHYCVFVSSQVASWTFCFSLSNLLNTSWWLICSCKTVQYWRINLGSFRWMCRWCGVAILYAGSENNRSEFKSIVGSMSSIEERVEGHAVRQNNCRHKTRGNEYEINVFRSMYMRWRGKMATMLMVLAHTMPPIFSTVCRGVCFC